MPTTNDNSIVTKGILRYFYGKLDNNVNTLLSLKADKEDGKGLSTNDFTNAYKNKLDGLSNYSLPIANGSKLGGIKTGYASTGKTYGVQVDADGDAYVSVPWTDTNTTYNVVSNNANGLTPMLPNDSTKFLNGQGKWTVPETGSDINPDEYVKKSGDTMTGDLNMEADINFGSQKGMFKDQSNRLIIGDTEHHIQLRSMSKASVYNGKSGAESIVDTGDIVDNLSSTETKKPLSAAQGKVLNDKILKINKHITAMRYVTKVFQLQTALGFIDLYTKAQLMELLGLSGTIAKFNEKIWFQVISGDWSSNNAYISSMAYDNRRDVMYARVDNGTIGACRFNFLIVYSEEGEMST